MTALRDTKRMVAATRQAPAPGLRLLVVEDSEIGLELTCMMAQRLGIDVDGAADGHEAVQLVAAAAKSSQPYSLVLMDFMMPIVDGIEATRRIRRAGISPQELPIIALTAIVEPRELSRFTEAGGQGYLAKPVSLDKLSAVLDAWLPDRAVPEAPFRSVEDPAILGRYAERKHETIAQIAKAIREERFDAATIAEIRDSVHKLAGTAGMFGDDALSVIAARCESELAELAPDEAPGVFQRNLLRLAKAA
jgi:two-component system, sensor histidine kinase